MRILRISHSAVVGPWRERERELRRRGHDVELLGAHEWDEFGRRVRLVPEPGEPAAGVRVWGSHPALFVYDPLPLWRALGRAWDVVDIHEEPFALATAEVVLLLRLRALLARRPAPPFFVYTAQNLAKRYPVPFRWFERAVLRSAAGIHACNDEGARIVRAKGARGAVRTIPLGLDPRVFSPGRPDAGGPGTGPDAGGPRTAAPDAGGQGDGAPATVRVGYAGRLASHKGVSVLVDAVLGDARLRLELAGAGPQEAELRRRAAPAGDRVRFRGALEGDDLVAFYRGLDVLAVPSLETPGWVEQFGRVAVEAMACGTPVVATATGALPDVVGDAGLLVPPSDAVALRDALLRAGTDPELAARLRADGLSLAETCTWAAVAARYEELYGAGAARHPHGAHPAARG